MTLHLIKLCVGCDSVDELLDWRRETFPVSAPWILRTRQTPRRAEELLAGGALYRVYKGRVLSRQAILAIATVGAGAAARCEITLDPHVIRTHPAPRRAFQGWRYLDPRDAPPDLGEGAGADMPPDLALELREAGVW